MSASLTSQCEELVQLLYAYKHVLDQYSDALSNLQELSFTASTEEFKAALLAVHQARTKSELVAENIESHRIERGCD